MPTWEFVEPSKRYVEVTINGQSAAVFHGSEIKAFGEASSGTIVVVPPADAPVLPKYYTRNGDTGSVPALLKIPANK